MSRHEIERRAYGVAYTEKAAFKDTYGGVEGIVFLECYQLVPKGIPSDTVLMFSHPVGGGAYLPMVTELARRGNHVIYANSRYRGNDSALIMEKVVLDLGRGDPPRARAPRIRADRARRLERRRPAVAFLPAAGRQADASPRPRRVTRRTSWSRS